MFTTTFSAFMTRPRQKLKLLPFRTLTVIGKGSFLYNGLVALQPDGRKPQGLDAPLGGDLCIEVDMP